MVASYRRRGTVAGQSAGVGRVPLGTVVTSGRGEGGSMTFGRVRALIFVAVLFVAGGIVVATAISRDSQATVTVVNDCAGGLVPAKTRMPERNEVTINVFNGTKTAGLAESVADEMKFRGFKIDKIATAPKQVNAIASINFGPMAIGAAYLVSANFLVDQAVMNFDIHRTDAEVDVTIGTQFEQLATTTEVNQSIAAIGNPPLPDGTCNAPGNKA
jgi:hypothetical protein